MVPQLCPYCKKDLMIVLPRDGGGCPEDGTPKRIIRGCIWKALSACQGKVHSRASLLPVLNSSLFQGVLCYFQSLFAWVWQHCESIVAPQQLLGNMMRLLGVNCAYICKTTYNPTAECRLCDLISPFWCYDVTDVAPLKLASHVFVTSLLSNAGKKTGRICSWEKLPYHPQLNVVEGWNGTQTVFS